MKKLSITILTTLFITFFALYVHADQIRVTIDGAEVVFTGQPPVIVEGRTLVPVRGVFEQLGFEVGWNEEARQAALSSNNHSIVLTIGNEIFTTDNVNHTLDVPAQIIGGSTMLPIRAVLESVGYDLDWNEETRTIHIFLAETQEERNRRLDAERISNLSALLQNDAGLGVNRTVLSIQPAEIIPVRLTEETFFTQEELFRLALNAPTMEQTAPSGPHPNHRMTQAEVDAWVAEFWELGLNNWELLMVAEFNRVRSTYYNLPELSICPYLVLAARLTSQLLEEGHGVHGGGAGSPNLPHSSHAVAFYGGYGERVMLFGGSGRVWRGSHTWRNTPREAIQSWRNSPAHNEIFIIPNDVTAVGFGNSGGGRRTTAILVK